MAGSDDTGSRSVADSVSAAMALDDDSWVVLDGVDADIDADELDVTKLDAAVVLVDEMGRDSGRDKDKADVKLPTSTVGNERRGVSVDDELSEYVDVRDIVTEMGGAVVTTREDGGSSAPSTLSGLKIVIDPLQLEMSRSSRENTV